MTQEIFPKIQKRLHNIQCSLSSFTSVFSLLRIRPDPGNRGTDNTDLTGSAHNHLHPYSCRTDRLHILHHRYKRYMSHSFLVLFLFSSPLFEEGKAALSDGKDDAASISGTVPFTVDLFVYDSMDPRDTVLHFSGHSESSVSDLESMAGTLGRASGKRFAPGWKAEEIVFFTYGSQSWYETYYLVNGYEWKKAMDIWMTMLDTPNLEKRACLEYNIAAACYIQGDYRLAKEWLDLSQKDFRVYYSDTLMRKIEAGLEE